MTVTNAAGTGIAKASFPATSYVEDDEVFELTSDIYESYAFPGEKGASGRRRIGSTGQLMRQSDIDRLYPGASVSAISPATGPAAGGTTVTLTGTNLRGTTGVTFGGTAATAVTVVSETRVTCVTPAKTAGPYNVVVADDSGSVTKTNFYTYT